MTEREALKLAIKTLKQIELASSATVCNTRWISDHAKDNAAKLEEALAQHDSVQEKPEPEQEPVAWRDHVEQRLLTWRQSFVNKSGDQLALDDFMDKRSLDDLIEFVCDEYTTPPPSHAQTIKDQEAVILRLLKRYAELEAKIGKPWVGLTDEDLSVCDEDGVVLARYWEAKLKEKNT